MIIRRHSHGPRRPHEPPTHPSQVPRRNTSGSPEEQIRDQHFRKMKKAWIFKVLCCAWKLDWVSFGWITHGSGGLRWPRERRLLIKHKVMSYHAPVSPDVSGPVQEATGTLKASQIGDICQFVRNDTPFTSIIKKHNYILVS